jgi:hypothetical protein
MASLPASTVNTFRLAQGLKPVSDDHADQDELVDSAHTANKHHDASFRFAVVSAARVARGGHGRRMAKGGWAKVIAQFPA